MVIRAIRTGLLALAIIGSASAASAADKVLRVVPHADLKVLDPHTNTATITLMHGHMIFDTLFAWDAKLRPKPQMVESYQISPDRLVYTFTLRSGLKFHDGQPIKTSDVIPSLKRWMVRDTVGQALATFLETIEATDDKTFVIRLKEPFAFVEMALGATASVIMRAQDAQTDPFKAVTEVVGSGHFALFAQNGTPGQKSFTRRTRTTSRAPNRPTALPVARWSSSTGSSGLSCRIPSPNRPRCRVARSTSSTSCRTTNYRSSSMHRVWSSAGCR